jgi:hypothetical protein
MNDLTPGARFGPYRVIAKLGQGGMGTVWSSVHEVLEKPVAIKVLHHATGESADRFLREGRAAAKLRHPHVVDVTDVGVIDGSPYLVMALLEGESLGALIRKTLTLDVETAIDIALPIVDALEVAHSHGIVHRDLKPDNIFLARGPNGHIHPILLDFGISKVASESIELTGEGALMGTPAYMSPEQARGARDVTPASDQFSFGLVLYEILSGRRAVTGDTLLEIVHKLSVGEFPPLASIANVGPIAAVVDRMLAIDPARRYPSMREAGRAMYPHASARARSAWESAFRAKATAYEATVAVQKKPLATVPAKKHRSPLPYVLAAVALFACFAGTIVVAIVSWPDDHPPASARSPLIGEWRGTYSGSADLEPPMLDQTYSDRGVVTVRENADGTLSITTTSDQTRESCTFIAEPAGERAVLRPAQLCTGRLANGATSNARISGDVHLDGDELVVAVHGPMYGQWNLLPYRATFTGTWRCRR